MTESTIFERFTSYVLGGAFSRKGSSPFNPIPALARFFADEDSKERYDGEMRRIYWTSDTESLVASAELYELTNGVHTRTTLSLERAAIAATIMGSESPHFRFDNDEDLDKPALADFAKHNNPLAEATLRILQARDALKSAETNVAMANILTTWGFWSHGDLRAIFEKEDVVELERVKALTYEVRTEAYAALMLLNEEQGRVAHFARQVLPEAEAIRSFNLDELTQGLEFPSSLENGRAVIALRAELVRDLIELNDKPGSLSLVEWVLKGTNTEQIRKRTLAVPHEMREAWFDASFDSFPKEKPTDKNSLDFFHWAFYASVTPEAHAELEEVFPFLPRAVRMLLVRARGETSDAMNKMLIRTSAATSAHRNAAKATSNK